MFTTSLLALKAFLNSVVADDLYTVNIEGDTLTIVRRPAPDVVLLTFVFDTPPVAGDPELASVGAPAAAPAKAEKAEPSYKADSKK